MSDVLLGGLELTRNDAYDILSQSESEIYSFATSEFKTIFRSQANINLLRKFNAEFKKDE